jgi:hypothetical protein
LLALKHGEGVPVELKIWNSLVTSPYVGKSSTRYPLGIWL